VQPLVGTIVFEMPDGIRFVDADGTACASARGESGDHDLRQENPARPGLKRTHERPHSRYH
jgi:hypothetical protein